MFEAVPPFCWGGILSSYRMSAIPDPFAMTNAKPSVFISYSHKDAGWMKRLADHLHVYELEEMLTVWEDRQIRAGQDWLPEIDSALQQARVAILLISNDFLISPFIRGKEVPPILERRSQGGLIVVPVIVKACNWQDVPWLSGIQARPPGKPLFGLKGNDRDEALAAIAKEIKELLQAEAPARPDSPPIVPSAPTGIPSAVHQLPAPPLDFTGRAVELEALKAAVRQGKTTALFGVRGMGGVGKTTLALKLAHEITPLYPDGQIFLDLLGVTTPLSAAEAMAHVIRAFHPERQLPASETELAPLYRSVLHGKRVLLLMDNAAGKEQVEPLLPPEGSALLVTSRVRFALPGLVKRDIDELPREESRELLLKICPRIGKHAENLARVCGNLPLALRVAASTLEERRALSPRPYLLRLAARRERLEPVETALSLSYKLLSKKLKMRWCQLAMFPDTFDLEGVAAVWKVKDTEPFLAELERNSLVELEEASKRYRLHDLVRSFVETRLGEAERPMARERHARHYVGVLRSADRLYLKGGEDLVRGLKLFDLEWRNIQAGYAFAATESSQSNAGAQLCNDYPRAGGFCLSLRQTPGEMITWLTPALAAAQRLSDRVAEGRHLGALGIAYSHLGEARRAIEFFEQCLAIARETGDRRSEGSALGNLGNAYQLLGEPHRAFEFYEQVLAIAREFGDRRAEGHYLNNLGLAYTDLRDFQRAIDLFEQALAITREIGDREGEGSNLCNLGIAYENLEEPHQAIESYEQHLTIAREIGDRRGEAKSSWNLGSLLCEHDDPARAVGLMQVLVDFEREIGHPDAEAHTAQVEAIRARINR